MITEQLLEENCDLYRINLLVLCDVVSYYLIASICDGCLVGTLIQSKLYQWFFLGNCNTFSKYMGITRWMIDFRLM